MGRALLTLAIPIIFGQLLQTAYQTTDAFWVGRIGAHAVAAVSISFPVTFLVIAMGAGLGIAGATLTAQYMGAGRQDMVNHVAAQTMVMVTITSVVLGTLGFIATPYLLTLLGVEPDVYHAALGFMRISFVGIVFVFIYSMFQALMRGVGQTKLPLLIVLGTVLLNFILDPLFIFGYGIVPAMGVKGAALATMITQAIAAAIGMGVFLRGRNDIQLTLSNLKVDLRYVKRAFLLGFPSSIELSTRGLSLIALSFLVASFGTSTLASYGIGSNVIQVILIPAMGLSMAVSTLVGQNIGAGNFDRAARATKLGAIWGFTMLSCVGMLAFITADHIVSFFIPDDAAVIARGAYFIRVMCLAWGGIGIQLSIIAAFRASGNMLNAMVLALVSQWMILFPLAYILSKHTTLGAEGIWWAFPTTNILVAIVAVCWFSTGSWREKRLTDEDKEISDVTRETLIEEGMR